MWTDKGKLRILGQEITYYYNIDSPAGPWSIELVFPDTSTLVLEWHSMKVDVTGEKNECELAELTTKSQSCDVFVLIKKILEACAEGKIYRDVDL